MYRLIHLPTLLPSLYIHVCIFTSVYTPVYTSVYTPVYARRLCRLRYTPMTATITPMTLRARLAYTYTDIYIQYIV